MAPSDTRRRPLAHKLLVLALASLFWLLVAEFGYRAFRALRGETYRSADTERRLDALLDDLRGAAYVPDAAKSDLGKAGMAIHPYLGYQIAWNIRTGQDTVRYFASPAAEANYDIVLLGGSVAAEFGNWAQQYLIPTLAADPHLAGRTIRLHNAACPGHKQPQHALTLEWLLGLGWKPDAVILLDGYNELAVSAENAKAGVHPLFPYWIEMQMRLGSAGGDPGELELIGSAVAARQAAEACRERLRRWPITASAFGGTWALRQLEDAVGEARERIRAVQAHEAAKSKQAHPFSITGPGFDPAPAAVLASSVEAWREGSRSIHAVCRLRGIRFLHVLQPAASDPGSKPLTPEEATAAAQPPLWAAAIAGGYPRLREVGAELAKSGVPFLDATQVFAGHAEPLYRDGCHFEGPGCAILGPFIARAFLERWKP